MPLEEDPFRVRHGHWHTSCHLLSLSASRAARAHHRYPKLCIFPKRVNARLAKNSAQQEPSTSIKRNKYSTWRSVRSSWRPALRISNPAPHPQYGYGTLDNVLTSMEFERMMNTGGPTHWSGAVKRWANTETYCHCPLRGQPQ